MIKKRKKVQKKKQEVKKGLDKKKKAHLVSLYSGKAF